MRMAGSLPRLPQRLMVRVETRRREATSETVRRSGRLARLTSFFCLVSNFGTTTSSWLLSISDIQIIR